MASVPPDLPIPPWLATRLRTAGGEGSPRYEASLYGPINCLLMWHFPVAQQYMIKPQGKIRPQYDSDIADGDDLARISLDSYGGEVIPRDERGGEQSVKIPDFIVVKLRGRAKTPQTQAAEPGFSVPGGWLTDGFEHRESQRKINLIPECFVFYTCI